MAVFICLFPANIYQFKVSKIITRKGFKTCSKLTISTSEQCLGWNLFFLCKFIEKEISTQMSFRCPYCWLWTYFTSFSSVFIVDFKYVFVYWVYCMFKGNNRNTRTRCEICSKLTIKTPERRYWRRSGVFIVNFEHVSHLLLIFFCWL